MFLNLTTLKIYMWFLKILTAFLRCIYKKLYTYLMYCILNVYNLMSLDVILFSSEGKHALRSVSLEFFMPAYSELNNEVIKMGLDTLKDYIALKMIRHLSYHALFLAPELTCFLQKPILPSPVIYIGVFA